MTIAQFTVLNHFERLGLTEKSPADLASAFQITRPTMTSTLARMEKSGLVKIKPDPGDGRAKLVSVTAKGRKMRGRCLKQLAGPMAEAGSGSVGEIDGKNAAAIARHARKTRSAPRLNLTIKACLQRITLEIGWFPKC